MKKIIVTIIILWLGHAPAQYQEISKQIFGKWQLKQVEAMGQKGSPMEVFGVAEAYQEYQKPNKFTGFLGEKVSGSFIVDDKSKTITVKAGKDDAVFKVKSFTAHKMVLDIDTEEGILTLHYQKK
ncbi:hypothetical protein [uncultured Tenacibaculum sp.]|uniref:hypothetical protein n=1 Tax=uncultured Tenacibaculum sp. TaxID=174713 RepID=UPI002609970C|nr:hypothetical protein [uncultured Tenacibaculum sp.]